MTDTLYYWYRTLECLPQADKRFINHKESVVGFLEEPEPKEIDKYNLREIGIGSLEDVTEHYIKEMIR